MSETMAPAIIQKLIDRIDLTETESRGAMAEVMAGQWSDAQIGAFLVALRMKGETADELVGFSRLMREKARSFWEDEVPIDVVDTAGTGGDQSGTFNISTAAAFVVAAAGARVAKHGNRAASSRSGSADVLEALGIDIQMSPEKSRRALQEVGIAFLFAPAFHSSMKHVMAARKELKVRTVFNVLGPLANPAGARFQVIGVFAETLLDLMANAVGRLGAHHAFVVHGADGLDEVSISGRTEMVEVEGGELRRFSVEPEEFGVRRAGLDALRGGGPAENARLMEQVLGGERGPLRDVVLLNAAPAIAAAGVARDLAEGFRLAEEGIDSGRAQEKLRALQAFSDS